MKLKTLLIFWTFTSLISPLSFSQSALKDIVTVPTPNAAVLLNDYNVPVNYYRGLPEITIPLYTLSLAGIDIPISLAYNASGVQIDQAPSWVGLGWNLTCGGIIVRNVNGLRDEQYGQGYIYSQRISPSWRINEDAFDNVRSDAFAPDADAFDIVYKQYGGSTYGIDPSPDEFIFDINGIRGKFYLDRNGNVVTDSKFHIEYVIDDLFPEPNIRNDYFKSFTVIDEKGVRYKFGPREYQFSTSYPSSGGYPAEQGQNIEWYLESIESPDGLTKIDLTYDTSLSTPLVNGMFVDRSSEQYNIVKSQSKTYKFYYNNITRVTQGVILLNKISTPNEEIIFETVPFNSSHLKRVLDKITIRNKITNNEWYYKFARIGYGPQNNAVSKFQLESIFRGSSQGEEPYYQFRYNSEPIGFASDNCSEQSEAGIDHWGYNNGPKTYKTRIPASENIIDGSTTLVPIDRSPSPTYTRAGSIEKIILPTKGTINFEFENNGYSYVSSTSLTTNKTGGGLRLKKIVYKDDLDDANDIYKTYSYGSAIDPNKSSGVITFEPTYDYNYLWSGYSCTFWLSRSIIPIDIGYSQVTETNGDGSKTVYRFNTAIDYPPVADIGDVPIVYNQLHEHPRFGTEYEFKKWTNTLNPYLINDNVNTHLRGTLKERLIFDSHNNKLQETQFTYQSWLVGKLFSLRTYSFDVSIIIGPNRYSIPDMPGMPYTISFLSKNYINVNRYELSSETVKTYKVSDSSRPLIRSELYSYNDFFYLKEMTTTQSDGKLMRNILTYPTDYNHLAMGGTIGSLIDLKARGLPVESLKIVDGKIVVGRITEYDNLARPTRLLNLETDGSITYSAGLLNPANHISLPSNYREKNLFRYNTGRLAEISEYGSVSSWQWGYSNSLVIAKAVNAHYNEIFFTSFEETGQIDVQAKTGGKTQSTPYTFIPPAWLKPNTSSKITYWFWNGQWNFKEVSYAGGSYTINDGSKIDELRVYPTNAHVTSYIHDFSNGLRSIMDTNGISKSFEYDPIGRLSRVRDNDNNLIQQIIYQYKKP